jgi:hypothetical protein
VLGIILGTIGIVIVTIGIGMLADRKLGGLLPGPQDFDDEAARERKKLVSHGAGEAPATALRVRDAQIANLRMSQRCPACRAAMRAEADDTVRYGETEMLVLHFLCEACGTKRALYIDRVPT